jgi:hypothetical protein
VPGFDDRLRRELGRIAEPDDPSGAFEKVMERKIRRRIARRLQVAALVVVVVAGTIGGTFALGKVFHSNRSVTPSGGASVTEPSPTGASPSPSATPSEDCSEETTAIGDFEGDDTLDIATVGPNDCIARPLPSPGTLSLDFLTDFALDVEFEPSGEGLVAPLADCQSACEAFASADLNGDGIDELVLLVDMGASTQFVQVFEFWNGLEGALGEPSVVLEPGAPGFPAGEPAPFAIGGSVAHQDFMTCRSIEGGAPEVIATSGELTQDQTTWNVHETVLTFARILETPFGTFTVVSTRDYTVPFDPTGETQLEPPGDPCWGESIPGP